jgi:RimJ/RimL family protein N-acetyltransferase
MPGYQDGEIVGVYWIEVDAADLTARTHHLFGDKTVWGTGAPLEVRGALMDWLFGVGVARVIGTPITTCTRAINGYIRQGFTLEGIMRSAMLHRWEGERHDLVLFRMLPEEWEAIKTRNAQKTS